MADLKPSLAAENQALKEAYDALNRNDIPAFLQIFDPEIERIEFAGLPGGGTYRGLEAVKEHVERGRGSWAEGICEPERFVVAGDRIIVFIHVRVRLKVETEWRDGRVGDVYTFRNGKAIQFRTFADVRQALEWAGVKGSASSQEERLLIVPVPSLVATLLRAERDKGSPLTESEVLAIRDKCPSIAMPVDVAAKVTTERGYDDIDPENAWEGWQAIRPTLTGGDVAAK
ncbi:hypothetical protein BH09SUM1_BH09SUM1_16300 [soil metagenome]